MGTYDIEFDSSDDVDQPHGIRFPEFNCHLEIKPRHTLEHKSN